MIVATNIVLAGSRIRNTDWWNRAALSSGRGFHPMDSKLARNPAPKYIYLSLGYAITLLCATSILWKRIRHELWHKAAGRETWNRNYPSPFAAEINMVNFTFLAGGYTSVISALSFAPGPTPGAQGSLSLLSQSYAGNSPSWIQRSPHNSSVL